MADLFERGKPTSFGRFYAESDSESTPLSNIYRSDPLSAQFVVPRGKAASDLVRYLIACQKQAFGTTIIEENTVNQGAILRGAQSLLKQADMESIFRAIKYASLVANHPFSFVFVREHALPELKRLCPTLIRFSEKTSKKSK
jgi:hypothetical protein